MRAIIIEDEKPAARYLSKMVQNEGVEVLATLSSVKESVKWFKQNTEPELIFLDIQLGDGLSFEIFEEIQPRSSIIFTTAYDEYALRAFKFNSIDYLLKPISKVDLKTAIDKFRQQSNPVVWDAFQLKSILTNNFDNKYRERFLIQVGSNLKTISIDEVACFYSKFKGTFLAAEGQNYSVEQSLSELEDQLNPKDFFRISRNAIVHLPFIDNIVGYSGSRFRVFIKNVDEELVVSRERVSDFKKWLEG